MLIATTTKGNEMNAKPNIWDLANNVYGLVYGNDSNRIDDEDAAIAAVDAFAQAIGSKQRFMFMEYAKPAEWKIFYAMVDAAEKIARHSKREQYV